jgi:hypothetical protein
MKKILALTLLSLLVLAPAAFAAEIHNVPTEGEQGNLTLKGDVEIDTTYDSLDVKGGDKVNTMDLGGRVYFQIIGRWENKDTGFFVAGQGQPLSSVDGTFGMDDAWFQFGNKSYSFKIGRFEAMEFLGTGGEDVWIASAGGPGRYQGNYARGRTNGGMALDITASDAMLIEVGAVYGQHADFQGISQNKYGIRPGVQFTMGNITVKGGAEVYMEKPQNDGVDGSTSKIGFGGQVRATVGNITLNGGAAVGKVEQKDYVIGGATMAKTKVTTTSVIGHLTMPMGDNQKIGFGAGYTQLDKPKDVSEMYGFATYEYKLAETTWVKLCGSYAKVEDGNSDVGARVRFNYGF